MRTTPSRTGAIAAVLVSGALLAGCASATAAAADAPATVSSHATAPASAVHHSAAPPELASATAAALAFLDLSAVVDQSFSSMETVAEQSQAIVFGTITRWLAGDTITTNTGMTVGAAILAEFTVTKVVEAQEGVTLRPGDTIYLPSPGAMDRDELAERAPKDLQALVYLGNELSAEELTPSDAYVVEPGDPEAAGAPRWILSSSQGFVVVDQDNPSVLVWPALGNVAQGSLADVLPGGRLDGLTDSQRSTIWSDERAGSSPSQTPQP